MKDNKAGKIQTNKPTKAKIIVWERKTTKQPKLSLNLRL